MNWKGLGIFAGAVGLLYAPEICKGVSNFIERARYPSHLEMIKEIEKIMVEKGMSNADVVHVMTLTHHWLPQRMGYKMTGDLCIVGGGLDFNYVCIWPDGVNWLRMMDKDDLREVYKTLKKI